MKGSYKGTERATETIRQLTLAGKTQAEICQAVTLGRTTVWKTQKELGLSPRRRGGPRAPKPLPKKLEAKVKTLLNKGWGARRIGCEVGVGATAVKNFKRKIGHVTPPGTPGLHRRPFSAENLRPWSTAKLRAVSNDILSRRGSAAAIARRHRVSYDKTLKLAHALLACQRFIPNSKVPLESYYPSRPTQSPFAAVPKHEPDVFVGSLQNFLNQMFNGQFPYGPEHDALFVKAMLTGLQEKLAPPPEVLQVIGAGLTRAVTVLRGQEQWLN